MINSEAAWQILGANIPMQRRAFPGSGDSREAGCTRFKLP